jgi:hypothetical protein
MKDDYAIAIIAAILLSGRGTYDQAQHPDKAQRLSMLEDEKRIAIMEAINLLARAREISMVQP